VFLFREYMHRVLFPEDGMTNATTGNLAVESGLACYYPASFRNDPKCGFYDLSTANPFTPPDRSSGDFPNAYGIRVWGSAFWELRGLLGQAKCDQVFMKFWQTLDPRKPDQEYPRYAASELLKRYRELGGDQLDRVKAVFTKRGLQL
jgi:hypothetical protein